MRLSAKTEVEGARCKDVPEGEIPIYENGIAKEMKSFMHQNRGIGLAAPQIGTNRNFFVMQYGSETISCYNPSWRPKGEKKFSSRESCLTYGHFKFANVRRYKMINAEFTNSEGIRVTMKLRGIDAVVFQHESDHLEGKTIFHNGGIKNA